MGDEGGGDEEKQQPKDAVDLASDPAKARPPTASFLACVAYVLCTVSAFTICIPTSTRYVNSLGGVSSVAGVLVGLTPIASGLFQPLAVPLLCRVPLKTVLIAFCGVNMVGNIAYGLGGYSGWSGTVFIARAVLGLVGGPTYASTYVARTTGVKTRSLYMQYVGVVVGCGYGLGPLLATLVEATCSAAGLDGVLLNANTAPGWAMALIFAFEAAFLACYMVEPPRFAATKPVVGKESSAVPPMPWARLVAVWIVVFVTPINVGCWDVHTAFLAEQEWGMTVVHAGLYLGGLNLLAVPFGFIPVAACFTDRQGLAVFGAMILAADAFFWPHDSGLATKASVYGVGSVLLLIAAAFLKAFGWGLVSKLPPPQRRQLAISLNSTIYMWGRGLGAVVAGYVTPGSAFATFLAAVNAAALFYTGTVWSALQVPS